MVQRFIISSCWNEVSELAVCRANSNMRLICGRAFRKNVFLKAIEMEASRAVESWHEELKKLNHAKHLSAVEEHSKSAKEHHTQLTDVLGDACSAQAGSQVR
jgi:hypothetical protein